MKLAMKACPYRKDFYAKLGPSEDVVRTPLTEWLVALEKIVQDMHQFYEYVRQSHSCAPTKPGHVFGKDDSPLFD